jgi:hypothetical protein
MLSVKLVGADGREASGQALDSVFYSDPPARQSGTTSNEGEQCRNPAVWKAWHLFDERSNEDKQGSQPRGFTSTCYRFHLFPFLYGLTFM